MDAQVVDRATLTPGECMFSHTGNGPMVDFRRDFDMSHTGRIYISVQVCKEIGQLVGLIEPQVQEETPDEGLSELEALRAEVLELRKFKESAKYTIESLGATVKNKPGRPKKELTSAAA